MRWTKLPLVFLLLIGFVGQSHSQTSTKRIVSGLQRPVFATQSPLGDRRFFVLEKDTGDIRIVDLNTESLQNTPFLTVTGLRDGGERGLLGMAFHPDYLDNGKFYVYASMPGGSQNHLSHVFEYTVSGDPSTSNVVDPDSRKNVMQFEQPFGNHNGGWIGFDPTAIGDDKTFLYIATGDGGSGGDPQNNSQDITDNPLGKMLRIDVASDAFPDDANANYSIPASNPFVGEAGDDEIWAFGLRNPWRSSFDRATGDLWIGDVGQGELEEIDVLPAESTGGQNYGWRIMEGTSCFRSGDIPCMDPALLPPVYEYGRSIGNSVTGGYVYRGPLKEFQGHYFFADFGSDNIWSLDPFSGAVVERNADLASDSGNSRSSIASFAEDNAGELYTVGIGGSIYRFESTSRDARWVGRDPNSGAMGDGETVGDANNWVRDGVTDVAFTDGDHLILSGANLTATDQLRVAALTFDGDATLTSGGVEVVSGNITVAEGVTGVVNGLALTTPSDPNSIRKLGPGQLRVNTTNARGSFTIIEGGTKFEVPGKYDVVAMDGATLDQEGTGDVFLTTLALEDGSTLRMDLGSDLRFSELIAGGTLQVLSGGELDDFPNPGERTSHSLLNTAQVAGQFRNADLDGSDFGHQGAGQFVTLEWSESDADETFQLSVVAYNAIPGDADGNGNVDFADFLVLSGEFGMEGTWLDGDFTSDGRIEFADFLLLSGNFGQVVTQAVAVPEPTTTWLVSIGYIILLPLRRRR